MEKYISLKEKKEDEKKYQMECKKIEEENDAYEAMCRKCDNREKDEYKEQKDDEFKIKMTKQTELNK